MASQKVTVSNLVPGSVLSEPVLNARGTVLLGKGVVITERIISLLEAWEIETVSVDIKEVAEDLPVENAPDYTDEEIDREYFRFNQEYNGIISATTGSFGFIRKQKLIPLQQMRQTSLDIYSSIQINGPALFNFLLVTDDRLADVLSRHSVMVAYFAGLIARQMRLDEQDVKKLALTGLLHDTGKLVLPKGAQERSSSHITEGAALLQEVKGLSNDVILGVLQHHECVNGDGFPTGVNGVKIHQFAKIVAVADVFHSQAYKGDYANPFPVLDLLAQEMFGRLDPAVCHAFIRYIKDCLLRTKILLSDDRDAEVIYFHPDGKALPIVRTSDNQIIDLSASGNTRIVRILLPNGRIAGIEEI